jgi:hypothetical protein
MINATQEVRLDDYREVLVVGQDVLPAICLEDGRVSHWVVPFNSSEGLGEMGLLFESIPT